MKLALNIGIVGTGGIGFALAAWLAHAGHVTTVWSPGGCGADALRSAPLRATGVLDASARVQVADSAQALAQANDLLFIALPVNGHRRVMDLLLPHLQGGQTVIVSSMGSLSALYLAEGAHALGRNITVASFGTTVLTARRTAADEVHIMTRRAELGVSSLPNAHMPVVLTLCRELFGEGFSAHQNTLASALTNVSPIAHGPLALFNWTRIERAEAWPQYHYMTPQVSAVIKKLDAERLALAHAFGFGVRSIERHFAQSFSTTAETLADIAAELHTKRGGPAGPTDTSTRFLSEDVPFGLVFLAALGRLVGVPTPTTDTIIASASLITGRDFIAENDLIAPLKLGAETVAGLLARVR